MSKTFECKHKKNMLDLSLKTYEGKHRHEAQAVLAM